MYFITVEKSRRMQGKYVVIQKVYVNNFLFTVPVYILMMVTLK